MEKKKYGWTYKGILSIVFGPMGMLFLVLGLLLWHFRAGEDPGDPEIFLYVFGGTGLIFLLAGLVFLALELRRRAKLRHAYEGGKYVMARIAGVKNINNVNLYGGHPGVVECHYTDPASGVAHIWYSRYLFHDISDLLTSDEVPVYIDRTDERVGFVDIDSVLPEIRVHR